MSKTELILKAKSFLKEGDSLIIETDFGFGLITDARLSKLKLDFQTNPLVLLSSDTMVNQTIEKPSELLWDLIDAQQDSLCIRTKASSYIAQINRHNTELADFVFLSKGLLYKLSKDYNKPLAFHKVEKEKINEIKSSNTNYSEIHDYSTLLQFKEKVTKVKILKLSPNSEIEIINT